MTGTSCEGEDGEERAGEQGSAHTRLGVLVRSVGFTKRARGMSEDSYLREFWGGQGWEWDPGVLNLNLLSQINN